MMSSLRGPITLGRDTHLRVCLAGTPTEQEVGRLLLMLSVELQFTGEARDLLVDATGLRKLDSSFDLDVLAWLVRYRHRIYRIAIVSADPACHKRVATLRLHARRTMRRFASLERAIEWLGWR